MTDITELTSVQKNANIHRLSRLIAYASNDEMRQMAVEVEHYTDQLIEALEKAQGMEAYWKTQCRGITDHCEVLQARIAELEAAEQKLCAANVTLDARAEFAEHQLAGLESRLDSADKLQDSAFRSGLQHGFSLGQTDDQKGYEHSMAAYSLAAGIKVEAE
ncbi:TPA: hypothetical protein ACXGNR_002813 [Escherichia coli]